MEFIFNDTVITDPTMDETGRFNVDTLEYYGKAMSRIDILIETKYPGRLKEMWSIIEEKQKEFDDSQFLEEDILESILIELDVI